MRSVAIHQPNYLPWLGYFYKINAADAFILLDDVDFQSGNAFSITNRAKIKTAQGELLLTVPVLKVRESKLINSILIDRKQDWTKKHLNSLRMAYAKSRHFEEIYTLIAECLGRGFEYLIEVNTSLIEAISDYLEIDTPLIRSSSLGIVEVHDKNERIVALCKQMGADAYLSGQGAKNYNDESLFRAHDIKLKYSSFLSPTYSQLYEGFIPNLSVVDCLFNCGKETRLFLNQ